MSRPSPWRAAIAAILSMTAVTASAAKPAPLRTYAIVETSSLFIAGQTIKIYRDGNRAMMEQYAPRQADGNQPPHTRTFYDLKAGRSYTLDLDNPLVPCGASDFKGDWGDPFAGAAQMSTELARRKPVDAGTDIVNGIATEVLVASTPEGQAKLWIDPKSSLLMKWQVAPPNGPPHVVLEVKEFSTTAPPAALLDVPAACTKASQHDESVHLTAVPSGGGAGVANAIMPPASPNSCTALLRVVRLGSMKPLDGYQVAIDRAVDRAHPAGYSVGMSADGHASFSGGGLKEETAAVKDGILRIENMPRQVHVELCFGKGGCDSAMIYRHCAAPETLLVFAVHNPTRLADGGEWYWIEPPAP